MTEQKQNWGFHAAGDLLDTPAPQPEPEVAPQPAPSRFAMTTKKPKPEVATVTPVAPQPVAAEPVAPTPVVTTPAAPKSTGFFMAAGDLLSAADGHHEESKGHSWDDWTTKRASTCTETVTATWSHRRSVHPLSMPGSPGIMAAMCFPIVTPRPAPM